jgi:SAM-dependent methyltransferase
MGMVRESLILYKLIDDNNFLDFSTNIKVADIGAQTIHFDDKPFFNIILESFGLEKSISENFYHNMTARFMHESMGYTYESFDLDLIDDKVHKTDLNTDKCKPEFKGYFDLVVNFGTTEHLSGQTNAFKFIHDSCKNGGFMISTLPCIEPNHGFFSYSPVFFESMAHDNGYENLTIYLHDVEGDKAGKMYEYTGSVPLKKCYINVIMRKINDNEFVEPKQVFNNGNFPIGKVA